MNTTKLRTKRVILPTLAAVALLGIGGVVWASTASADDLQGSERNRVGTAATQAVGGGKVVNAETSDDDDRTGEAYEVEVRKADGTEVDVKLDKDLKVIGQDVDDDRYDNDDRNDVNDRDDVNDNDGTDDANDTPDADDRVLSAAERASAEKAGQDAVGGGTIVDVDASDDRGVGYEVEVRTADNTEWNVDLDAEFKVLQKSIDR